MICKKNLKANRLKIKTKLISFMGLTFRDKLLFCVNFFLCGLSRIIIKTMPLNYFSSYFGEFYQSNQFSTLLSVSQLQKAVWIGKSVRLAAKYTPWNSSCLTQAMVGKFWCQFYKIPYVLYIGFAKDASLPGQYTAHAWTTAGAVNITGGNGWINYRVVSTYARFYEEK